MYYQVGPGLYIKESKDDKVIPLKAFLLWVVSVLDFYFDNQILSILVV